jgi:hypothetical protein
MASEEDCETESLALIGMFLHKWAAMEQTMHLAIACATKLDPLMYTIICANLTIRAKLNVLRTLIDVSDIEPKEAKANLKRILRDIGEYTPVRNMIAHDYFGVGSNLPGIGFMPIKAKGSFSSGVTIYSKADFEREYEKIENFNRDLMQVTVKLEHATFSAERLELPMRVIASSARANSRDGQPPSC